MKKNSFLLIAFVALSLWMKSQAVIAFTYDNAGNVVQRKLTVIPPSQKIPFSNPTPHSQEKDSLNVIEFKVFPNPTSDLVSIEGPLPEGIESAKIYLINSNGQIIKTDSYSGTTKSIVVGDLKPGVYYLEVNYSKERSSNYKIIVTN